MIELGSLPAGRAVALPAAPTELARMGIVLCMAVNAFQRRGLQVSSRTGSCMAGGAFQVSMPFLQGESGLVVIEFKTIGIDTIMAGQTVLPKHLEMSLQKGGIQLVVAAVTNSLVNRAKISAMAIGTGKSSPSRLGLVSKQRKIDSIMGKAGHIQRGESSCGSIVIRMAIPASSHVSLCYHHTVKTLWVNQ